MTLVNNGTVDELRAKMVSLANIVETVYGFPSIEKQHEKGED
jgi:hypothetical protein